MEKSKISIEQINEILLLHWDPIGIAEIPECQDEYLDYALHIWKRIKHDPGFNIFSYLRQVEVEQMSLDRVGFEYANTAANKIIDLLNM